MTARKKRRRKTSTSRKRSPKKAPSRRRRAPRYFLPQGKSFTSEPFRFRLEDLENDFERADIQLHGVDHYGASYEARIFLNNPKADAYTPTNASNRYAGSLHVFGHGTCYGDEGHCDARRERRTRDLRAGHPLTKLFMRLPITETFRAVAQKTSTIRVTVVPVIRGGDNGCDLENVFKCERMKILTYD